MNYYHTGTDANKIIIPLMEINKLIPVFGAGFTMNEKSGNNMDGFDVVPDGDKCCELFCNILDQYDPDRPHGDTLTDISKALFKSIGRDKTPVNEFHSILSRNFTGVELSITKREFLSLPWKSAFTINVDDGIENNSDFHPILPYRNARSGIGGKLLYKIHGDARAEIDYEQENNLVFNYDQYVHFIQEKTNQTIREALESSMRDLNLMYIGCSLRDEPDLRFLYGKIDKASISHKKNIMLMNSKPDSYYEESLEDDYGITDIILINNFDEFYQSIIKEVKGNKFIRSLSKYPFESPEIIRTSEEKYFMGYKMFDVTQNVFRKSDMIIRRDILAEVNEKLVDSNVLFIEGRRFSGKTALLCLIAEQEKTRRYFYFPSGTQIDTDVVRRLYRDNHDVLFLFDSNSMLSETYFDVKDIIESYAENNNKTVIALNQSDSYITDIDNAVYLWLDGKFSSDECHVLRDVSRSKGFLTRTPKDTNLNYIEKLNSKQKIPIFVDVDYNLKFTSNEQILLLILCVRDKIYSRDYSVSLDISSKEINDFLSKISIVVERIQTSKDETRFHSGYKLVHNSSAVIIRLVRKIKREDIIDDIRKIVSSFKNGTYEQKRIYREVMLFDSLNQVFSETGNGAGDLVFDIYANLEDLMGDDLHYWLQRSKSIYRLKPNDYNELMNSYRYATKAYHDADLRSDKLKKQSALSISLIATLLSGVESDVKKKKQWLIEAIQRGHEAIFSDYYREEKYIRNILLDRRKNYIEQIIDVCNQVESFVETNIDGSDINFYGNIIMKAAKIKEKMERLSSIPY